CSGSMLTVDADPTNRANEKTYTVDTRCRFHRATGALRKVLPSIFDGTQVTVLVFGHKDGKGLYEEVFNQRWRKGNQRQEDQLMEVERSVPYYDSPIVRTMAAAEEKYLAKARGAKTMLVLTDGNDTVGDKNTDPAVTNE